MVVAVFSHPLSPIQQRVIVVFTRYTSEPSSSMLGVDQSHVSTAAGTKTRSDPEIHVLGEVEFSPCRLEVFNRDGHVVFVDTPATTSVADIHGCLHVVLPPFNGGFMHLGARIYRRQLAPKHWSVLRFGVPHGTDCPDPNTSGYDLW